MKYIATALLAVCVAASASASVKVGYGTVAAKWLFTESDATSGDQKNASESLSMGMITVGADSMTAVNDMLSVGLEVGAGAPMGEATKDLKKQVVNLPSGAPDDIFDGSSKTIKAATASVLVKAVCKIAAGPGEVSLGIGAGTTMVGLVATDVEQDWDNSAVGGGTSDSYKMDNSSVKADKYTDTMAMVVPVFTLQITPGYSMAVSDKDSIGLEVPLSINSVTKIESETDRATAISGVDNPQITGDDIGGFSWGVNIVYSKKI